MLIAEIGNNHMGSMLKAKELIKSAYLCGATVIKSQAFLAEDVASTGSMPREFYAQCEFSFAEYVALIKFSRDLGVDLFYSIFSPSLLELRKYQKWHKVAGAQSAMAGFDFENYDNSKAFISIKEHGVMPKLKLATVMGVSGYFEKPSWEWMENLELFYGRPIGYSDHNVGIDKCLEAIKRFKCPVIEKHFTVDSDIYWKGKHLYRDTVHGATPFELKLLSEEMRKHEKNSLRYM